MEYLSKRINAIKPSPTIAVSDKANELKRQGRDIITLGAGEPDFDTPEHIKRFAITALENGATKYTAVDGTAELKSAIIEKFKRENALNYSANQILVSCGAKHSIYNLLGAVINPGDEVIIPAPYWVSYPDMTLLFEGVPVCVTTTIETQLKLTPALLEANITPKTKLLILNSPSNPSGMAYTKEELAALGKVLLKHPQVLICTDDIYEHILWNHKPYANILNACPELYDRTIVINGVSKAYAMTGWRIGYAAGSQKIIAAMKKMQSQSTSNPTAVSQAASVAALNGDQTALKIMCESFKQRHDLLVAGLNNLPGVKCLPADGAFYAFPNVEGAMKKLGFTDDLAFSEYLLDKANVAVVPGSAFGLPGYIRLSYATSMGILKTALARISAVL